MTKMKHHQKLRYYDLAADEEALRISGFDGKGGEFWIRMTLPVSGAERRRKEAEALAAIAQAIAAGLEPGQVIVDG